MSSQEVNFSIKYTKNNKSNNLLNNESLNYFQTTKSQQLATSDFCNNNYPNFTDILSHSISIDKQNIKDKFRETSIDPVNFNTKVLDSSKLISNSYFDHFKNLSESLNNNKNPNINKIEMNNINKFYSDTEIVIFEEKDLVNLMPEIELNDSIENANSTKKLKEVSHSLICSKDGSIFLQYLLFRLNEKCLNMLFLYVSIFLKIYLINFQDEKKY